MPPKMTQKTSIAFTIRDLAEMLNVPIQTLRRALDRSEVTPCGKIGPSYVFALSDYSDVEQALADYKAKAEAHK